MKIFKFQKGFSLIELMVAVSVFSVIMFISTGAILSIVGSNQKSKNLRSTTDNANLVLDSISRTARFGNNYHCGSAGDITTPADCAGGSSSMTLKASDGTRVTYGLVSGRITRVICPVAGPCGNTLFMTADDMTITNLTFWVNGSGVGDTVQPRVSIVIGGFAGAKVTTRSVFLFQTTASQKKLDI